jgi:thiamine-phosphate pyrophosphorylase
LITDRRRFGEDRLERIVEEAVEGGVNLVQLREKDLPEEALLSLARRLRRITQCRALLTVNGSVRVALEAGADGVHLRDESADADPTKRRDDLKDARAEGLLIGRSVHDAEGAEWAAESGADYLQLGSIFETASHPGEKPGGVELIREVRRAVSLPIIAVGGITERNAGACIAAGASGVAVISAIGMARNPRRAAQGLREAIQGAKA